MCCFSQTLMSVFVCSSSTRIHHFRAFLFTCYSPNNKRLHSTFLSYHFGIPIFKQKCDHFCCFQHQNNVYERPLLLFRKNLSLKVNNEQSIWTCIHPGWLCIYLPLGRKREERHKSVYDYLPS